MPSPDTVVFDLGGVLVHWDPRLLFRPLLGPGEDVDSFLEEIGFADWNLGLDAGRRCAEAVRELSAQHPHRAELIAAYPERFPESIAGLLDGTVEVVGELRAGGVRLLGLTNWSGELFSTVRGRLTFLDAFDGVVVSGEEGMVKPDRRLFEVLIRRYGLRPAETVYVDDAARNVEAAADLGFRAHHFTDATTLRAVLVDEGLLPRRP